MIIYFFQTWTNWGLRFESILSSADQKKSAGYNLTECTEIYIGTLKRSAQVQELMQTALNVWSDRVTEWEQHDYLLTLLLY